MAKRRVVRALFDNLDQLSPEQIATSEALKGLLKNQVPLAIEEANNTKKQYATIFEINDTGNYIVIHKRDWQPAIESCIAWYLESEEYEKCSELKELISRIKKSTKKIKIKTEEDEQ